MKKLLKISAAVLVLMCLAAMLAEHLVLFRGDGMPTHTHRADSQNIFQALCQSGVTVVDMGPLGQPLIFIVAQAVLHPLLDLLQGQIPDLHPLPILYKLYHRRNDLK